MQKQIGVHLNGAKYFLYFYFVKKTDLNKSWKRRTSSARKYVCS